jgi:8-oxo-dGTP pyrophosphatase MutT (NUDIX family)
MTPVRLPIQHDQLELLMVRRRDSMAYTEFVRGKYDVADTNYILRLLNNVTVRERNRIAIESFDQLWDRLWGKQDKHGQDYQEAKVKFEQIDHHYLLNAANTNYEEPEWGFPKGRRARLETDQVCAEREFLEETNIPRSKYVLLSNVVFQETFIGTNGVPYQHKYMIGLLQEGVDLQKRFTTSQAREVSAIGWRTIPECLAMTRPHYTGREQMLSNLAKFLQTVELEKIPR